MAKDPIVLPPILADVDAVEVVAASTAQDDAQGGAQGDARETTTRSTGVRLSVGAAFAAPVGHVTRAAGDTVAGRVPWTALVPLRAGVAFTPNAYVGAWAELGIGPGGGGDARCASRCTAGAVAAGVDVAWTFRPATGASPWIGWGMGIGVNELSRGDVDYLAHLVGLQLARLEGGVDLRVSPTMRVGPFATAALETYVSEDAHDASRDTFGAVHRRAAHAWLQLGVRVVAFP